LRPSANNASAATYRPGENAGPASAAKRATACGERLRLARYPAAFARPAVVDIRSERTVMLGSDIVLPGSLVRDPRLDYVALGHIHKSQNLNPQGHPPVIYPGSIERVDFGECNDEKYFILARVSRGETQVEWRKLAGIRPFVDRRLRLETQENITNTVRAALPDPGELDGAVVRLTLEYPRQWEAMIDDAAFQEHTAHAFEFHLIKRPQMETRIRLPEDQTIGTLTPLQLLEVYWRANHSNPGEIHTLLKLAGQVIQQDSHDT